MPAGAAAAAAARTAGRVPATGLRGGTFEYTFEQDALIKDLARNIRTVSWVLLALALLLLVRNAMPLLDALKTRHWAGLLDSFIAFLGAGVLFYSFAGLRQAAGNFALIPESQGQDQQLTVQAFRGLNRLFNILSIIVIVVGALVMLSFVVGALSTAGGKPSKKKDVPKATAAAVWNVPHLVIAGSVPQPISIDRATA
jgi:hypothetical protein